MSKKLFAEGQKVIFKGAVCVNEILTIKNKSAIVFDSTINKAQLKRLSSLRAWHPKVVSNYYEKV